MKKLLLLIICCALSFPFSLVAEDASGDVYVAGAGKYLWRGQLLYDKSVLQPGLDLNYKKLSLGLWMSYNTLDSADKFGLGDAYKFGEADVTISFSDSYKKLGYSLGYTYYTFPNFFGLSSEYSLGLSMDVFLSPGIILYYDVAKEGGDGGYLDFALSFPFTLGIDFSFDTSVGYNLGQWGLDESVTVLGLNLSATYSIGSIDITPGVFGQIALDDQYKTSDDKVFDGFGSFGVTYNF